MALAAVIVGRWLPLGTLAGCLMFGATEALQLRAQAFNLPVSSYVIQMVPYLAALLVLAGSAAPRGCRRRSDSRSGVTSTRRDSVLGYDNETR